MIYLNKIFIGEENCVESNSKDLRYAYEEGKKLAAEYKETHLASVGWMYEDDVI